MKTKPNWISQSAPPYPLAIACNMHKRASYAIFEVLVIVLNVCMFSCHSVSGKSRPKRVTGSREAMSFAGLKPYPKGAWRLAAFEDVNRTVLWVSHIVIRDKDSVPGASLLRPPGWDPDPAPPERTSGEALHIAQRIAEQAQLHPAIFGELARDHSEDVVTRDWGGSLGGLRAGQLPRQFLDALQTLDAGEVSQVIETPFGYHVLELRGMPDAFEVAGRRIVIRYTGCTTYESRPGYVTERSRDNAKDLAAVLAERGKATRDTFPSLVEAYSEDIDAVRGGEFGIWSTRDPQFNPRLVEILSNLEMFGVSQPIDTAIGFQVLQRIPVLDHENYAITSVVIDFDPVRPSNDSFSKNARLLIARSAAARLQREPSYFERLQSTYCCAGQVERWTVGSEPVVLSDAIRNLALGEIATTPIQFENAFYIIKRLDPSKVHPAPLLYRLPKPDAPDLEALMRNADGVALATYVRRLGRDARDALKLNDAKSAALMRTTARIAAVCSRTRTGSDERASAMAAGLSELALALGPGDYQRYQAFVNRWSSREYLALQH